MPATRSRIPEIQKRAKEIILELKKNKDVLDIVLDEFAPLSDESEAPAQTEAEAKAAKCKFAIGNGEPCGAVESDPIHGSEDYQHRFQARKSRTKKALPDSVSQRVAEDVKKAIEPGDDDSETCAACQFPPDANIHHLSKTEGYHEFRSAA